MVSSVIGVALLVALGLVRTWRVSFGELLCFDAYVEHMKVVLRGDR